MERQIGELTYGCAGGEASPAMPGPIAQGPQDAIFQHAVKRPLHHLQYEVQRQGLFGAAAAAAGWTPEHGDIDRVPAMLHGDAHLVNLFHVIHKQATIHHAEDVRKAWEASVGAALQFIPLDAYCMALPHDTWLQVFAAIPTKDDLDQYVSEAADCDKHSFLFYGLCSAMFYLNGVGVILDFSGAHSYNAVLVQPRAGAQPEIRIVEPQAGAFVPEERLHSKPYSLEQGSVLYG